MHIDCNQEEDILVYPYFRSTLLALIQEDPDFPPAERKKILQRVGEAIQELHGKDWIHIGTLSTIQKLLSFKTSN
jgi:tRNA A-37 threonylcarbamoyl transferase component Bud32